jgi:hypothetical protein
MDRGAAGWFERLLSDCSPILPTPLRLMKIILLATCALITRAISEPAIPSAYGTDRYVETFAKSPFVFAVAEPVSTAPAADHLKDLVVTGLGKLDDGRDFVVVQRAGDSQSMRFEGVGQSHDGFGLEAVKWADRWSESRVIITYGAEKKELKFSEQAVPRVAPGLPNGPKQNRQTGNSARRL